MKMLTVGALLYYLVLAMFGAVTTAQASVVPTVFTPSDGDVDIINLELFGGGFNDGQFAALTQPMDLVGNVPQNAVLPLNFGGANAVQLTTVNLKTVQNLPSFSLAVYDGFDWHYESSFTPLANLDGAILRYDWDFGVDEFEYVDLAVVDATAVVPVPAAVWLFLSGGLGLLAVARRRATIES